MRPIWIVSVLVSMCMVAISPPAVLAGKTCATCEMSTCEFSIPATAEIVNPLATAGRSVGVLRYAGVCSRDDREVENLDAIARRNRKPIMKAASGTARLIFHRRR